MVGLGHAAKWYYKNVIWLDLCNSIIPKTKKKATDMASAHKLKVVGSAQAARSSAETRKATRYT